MIWTFTFLSDFQNCPRKAQARHVLKNLPKETGDTSKRDWGIDVHKALERRIVKKRELPANMPYEAFAAAVEGAGEGSTVFAEQRLAIDSTGGAVDYFNRDVIWGRGKADVLIMRGDTALIFDWKTGKIREDPFELEIYGLLAKAAYPGLSTIRGSYVWLTDRKVGSLHDVSNASRTFNEVKAIMKAVEMLPEGIWPANPNPLCRWCPKLDCEHNKAQK